MMKKIFIVMTLIWLGCLMACQDITVGYLKTEEACYLPDSLIVRRVLDPTREPDKMMIHSGADWVSNSISGVLGTNPVLYEITNVKVVGEGNADLFREQLRVIGGGRFYFPSKDIKAPNGTYLISIRIKNPGYESEKEDIFTFILK